MKSDVLSPSVSLRAAIDDFWSTIPHLWNLIKGNLRSIAVENYSISVEQFHVIRLIRKGVTSVSELAEMKQISRSAVSQAVDLLVERGLINRRQNLIDRRNIPLELTPSGDQLLDAILEKNRSWMEAHMSSLSCSELEVVSTAMQILSRTFSDPLKI